MNSSANQRGFSIVDGDANHLGRMQALYAQSQAYHHTLNPLQAPELPEAEIERFLRPYLDADKSLLRRFRRTKKGAFVAIANNEVIGYLLYAIAKNRDMTFTHRGWVLQIEDIAVDPKARNGRVAIALCDLVVETASSTYKPCLLKASVWNGNRACVWLLEKFLLESSSSTYLRMID